MRECDNLSVGVVLEHEGDVLLLERARYPFGWAAPAGHVDEHGGLEEAAVTEVFEEVGIEIPISGLAKVIDGRRVDLACRRPGGDHHVWTVYSAEAPSKDVVMSEDETTGHMWVPPHELRQMIEDSRGLSAEQVQNGDRVLEQVWLQFFVDLGTAE